MGYEHSSAHGELFAILKGIYALSPITQMGPQQRKSFLCDTSCLFLMSRLIVNYFLSNCGGGPGLSICSGRPLMACNGANVILKLMRFVLQWHSVPSKPPISQQAQREGSPWGTLPVPPLEGVTCKLPLYGGSPVFCLAQFSASLWGLGSINEGVAVIDDTHCL